MGAFFAIFAQNHNSWGTFCHIFYRSHKKQGDFPPRKIVIFLSIFRSGRRKRQTHRTAAQNCGGAVR